MAPILLLNAVKQEQGSIMDRADRNAPPFELDVAPDGERWRYRKRWRQGFRRFLPSLWHVTDEAGLKALTQQDSPRA